MAQEVGLAKRLTVLCGDYKFDWQEMELVAQHALTASYDIAWNCYSASLGYPAARLLRFTDIRCLQEHGIDRFMPGYRMKLGGRNEDRNAHLLAVLQMTGASASYRPARQNIWSPWLSLQSADRQKECIQTNQY